ncbi:hypothetical protein CWR48_06540 [Oceanobacillus arenosus]|uniref:SSD domain-containing protein n=1 Tax=Oceanobacillus arenosus TaxID=1229153 RepID=A0A3D8PXS2_9BACI|nr:MMPL family transporter [Oceanobacillus arenosus]RDW20337.1 hypothetical protein CWR48_06540 [Oceanobacillus arenosus]
MKNVIQKFSQLVGGRVGRWVTLAVWVVLIVILQLFFPNSSEYTDDTIEPLPSNAPSMEASTVIEEKFPNNDGFPALVTWYREDGITEEDLKLIQSLAKSLENNELQYQEFAVPYNQMPIPALQEMVSEDGTTFLQPILFQNGTSPEDVKGDLVQLEERVETQFNVVPFNQDIDSAELVARVTGPAGISVDATELFENADVSLLIGTVLLVLVILLLIYRSPILPFIPIIAVGAAYAVTTPILGWLAQSGYISYDSQGIAIMTVLLFGAGTDYCLFLISRFRQFLYEEQNNFQALKKAFMDTSGVIAISGLTVASALMALLISKYATIHNFAIPFGLSIFIMMISSLTLVPALLSILGRTSFFPFIPRTNDMEERRAKRKNKKVKKHKQSRFWHHIGEFAAKKPIRTAILTLLLLLGSSAFVTQVNYSYDILSSFPEDTPSRQGFELISDAFGSGDLAPVQVLFDTGGKNINLQDKLSGLEGVSHAEEPQVSEEDDHFVMYQIELEKNPYSNEGMDDLAQLKEDIDLMNIEEDLNGLWVGGQTAEQLDQRNVVESDETMIITLVIVIISVLLLVYLRSITAMLYLVATVLISFTSALGLGWIILHYGFGVPAISGLIPIYAFVFIVALGEDYNIFMISNIWERRKTMPLKDAIREGVGQSGGVITSAGIILAGTFAVLTTLPIQVLVQFGLITAIGVLLDTFIVRPLLVPAITSLFGKWAFWPSKQMNVRQVETEKRVK